MLLQKRGAAAFAILTEPFADQVDRVMAYQRADRSLPAVVLEHPMQNLGLDELQRRAEALADGAQRLLAGEWEDG